MIDWYAWSRKGGVSYDYLEPNQAPEVYRITLDDLLACLKDQGSSVEPGDILLIRTGWVTQYKTKDLAELERLHNLADIEKPETIGLQIDERLLKWLWEGRFSAIGADNKSVETWSSNCPRLVMHGMILC